MAYGYTYQTQFTAVHQTKTLRKPTGITIHHWGSTGQTFEGVRNGLAGNNPRNVSANYVAQGSDPNGVVRKIVACIVDPDFIAWHAGTWAANVATIGIECRPEATAADYDVVSELVARLWKVYGKIPLWPHKHWVATLCPGKWDLSKIAAMASAKLPNLDKPPVVVPPVPAVTTATTITTAVTQVTKGTTIRLDAKVTPTTALGKANFQWKHPSLGWQVFGGAIQVANGNAFIANTPSTSVTYRVSFVPMDATKFKPSMSAELIVGVVNLTALVAEVTDLKARVAALENEGTTTP